MRFGFKNIYVFAFLILGLCFAPQSHAAKFSGAYLLELCEKDDKGKEKVKGGHVACQAYIAGVLDYHSVLQSLKIAPKIDVCVPKDVTMNKMHDVVLVYLRQNAEHDGFIASPAVTMALYNAWPCKKK